MNIEIAQEWHLFFGCFFFRCDLLRELDLIWRVFKILGVDVDPQKSNGVLAKI